MVDMMKYYSSVKKNEIITYTKWMELGTIILSEGTQIPERDKHYIFFLYVDTVLGFQCVCYNLNNFRSEELGRGEGKRILQRGGGNRIHDDKGK